MVLGIHILDSKIFQGCESFKNLEESNLNKFIYNPLRKVYPSLIKMFYSNLYFTDGIIYSKVRKHEISLTLEEIAKVLDLSHDEPRFNPDEPEERDNYMYKSDSSSFLLDTNSCISSPFTIDSARLEICLIHYVKTIYSF